VELSESVVALGLVSKGMGLPGLRTGWLVSRDPDALNQVAIYKDFTSICGPSPSEFLAAIALRHRSRILAETRTLLAANRERLEGFMARHAESFVWVRPAAGPVAFPRLRDPGRWGGVDVFCRRAREEAGVLIAPGSLFGGLPAAPEVETAVDASVRIGFGRAAFADALTVFERWFSVNA
jgi:aspartate/methionine/tyrosine aminotransferase